MFRSTINDAAIDNRGRNRSLFVEFVIRFRQVLVSRLPGVNLPFIVPTTKSRITPTQKIIFEDFAEEVGNYTDGHIDNMTIEDLCASVRKTGDMLVN